MAGPVAAEIEAARYVAPTDRYPHAVLGDAIEYGALEVTLIDGRVLRAVLPEARVFEDTAPRVVDVTGDGAPEVITVESDQRQGARLVVWAFRDGALTVDAASPFIGTRFRWLAPLGAADLDGDGAIEIAWVDRPHLARVLRIWRYRPGRLTEVTSAAGHTNHRIGEPDIAGGIRDCGTGPEMITASTDWRRLLASRLDEGQIVSRDIGPHRDRASFAAAMACQ